jgi:crotonobetaine/carnitine-CoA ligase
LLEYLWGRLPYFMLPRYILFLDELPRTATHKVDMVAVMSQANVVDAWDREASGIQVTRAGIARTARGAEAS